MFCYNFYHKGLRTAAVLIFFEINSPDVTKTYYFISFYKCKLRSICLYNVNEYIFIFLLKSIVMYAIISSKLWLIFMQ